MQVNVSTIPKLSLKIFIAALFCMTVHVFWCNSAPIWSYIFSGDSTLVNVKSLVNTFVFVVLFSCILAIVFSINILLGRILISIINLIGVLYTYYVLHFGIQMSDEVMVSMLFFAESNDITSSFDWTIFIYVPLLFIPSHIAITFVLNKLGLINKFSFNNIVQKIILSICSVTISILLLFAILGTFYVASDPTLFVYRMKTIAEQTMPTYFLTRKSNIKKLASANTRNTKLKDYQDYGFSYDNDETKDPLIVVLIIGESLRSDRLSINGYPKSTTPLMEKIPNLYSFKNVLACSTTTAVSLPCMLTDELQDDWIRKFTSGQYEPKYSVAKIFTDQGFDTKWLSAANKDYGIYIHKDFHGSKDVLLSNELRRKYISTENDFGDSLLVKAMNTDIEKDTLFVLGTMGSHREYFSRYPKHLAKFKPDVGKSDMNISNAYDNTVVYFDKLISDLTEKLKNKNAVLFYVSDHGESLGENGIYLHGAKYTNAPKEQILVPMISWMSDKYIETNPDKHENIQHWAELNKHNQTQIKHDFLFHSLLDCSGFTSSKNKISSALSVCAKR